MSIIIGIVREWTGIILITRKYKGGMTAGTLHAKPKVNIGQRLV